MGHEDPCKAPPIILKKTKIQIIIKTRLNLTDTKTLGMTGAGSHN